MELPPLTAARALRAAGADVALLASGTPGATGRRSLLATAPDLIVVAPPGSGAGLPALGPRMVGEAHGRGLWLGAISYDAGLELHGIGSRHRPGVPAYVAAHYPAYAEYDHEAAAWELRGGGPGAEALRRAVAAQGSPPTLPPSSARTARSPFSRAGYALQVEEARRLIAAGELFELNLAHVLEAPWEAGGWELFERLMARSPGDHAAYLSLGGVELASISPELFLRIEDGRVETRPIKGTRPRGADAREDAALAAALAASTKDRAENVMIVDLLRNDLTATAAPASVRVEELCVIERTASVMHLVSSVTAQVADGVRLPDVLVGCFPGGSITGAPKRRAMELIDRLEAGPRGFYCGSVFAWEPGPARLGASVAIRTATVQDGIARYGAGGAVTLLSDPAGEADETMLKAAPFLDAVGATVAGWS